MKAWKVTLGLALGAMAALALAAFAVLPSLAQTATPTPQTTPGAPGKTWDGFGHGREFGRGFGFGHDGASALVSATASVTGLTTQEVMTELQGGKSLAQIAEGKGKTADDVIKAARAQLDDQLKQAVTDGRLTQAQADAKLQQFDQTATQVMNDTTLGQRTGGCPFKDTAPTPATPTNTSGGSA